MNLVRMTFIALALLLPTVWTVAKAGDEIPAAETKKPKKAMKAKKGDGEKKEEKKAE